MDKKERDIKITHLKCREIQAPIVSSLIKAFVDNEYVWGQVLQYNKGDRRIYWCTLYCSEQSD